MEEVRRGGIKLPESGELSENIPWDEFVEATNGWSGRAIQKLVDGWQNAGYTSENGTITLEGMRSVVEEMKDEFSMKEDWEEVDLRNGPSGNSGTADSELRDRTLGQCEKSSMFSLPIATPCRFCSPTSSPLPAA